MSLKGGPELRARLKALRISFKPLGKEWADDTVRLARTRAPVRTGKLKASIRRRNATQRRATVVAVYYYSFIEKGTQAHSIEPRKTRALRWQEGGGTVFSKKVNHPRTQAKPFGHQAAVESLANLKIGDKIIDQWNKAA